MSAVQRSAGNKIYKSLSIAGMGKREKEMVIEPSGSVSFSRGTESMMSEGVNGVVEFSGIEVNEGVEDLAAEFQNLSVSEINTSMHVISLKLNGNETTKGYELTNLEKVGSIFKKESPFMRFERIEVFYIPLFTIKGQSDSKLTISVIDESMIDDSQKVKCSVKLDLARMSASKFYMNFCVRPKDAKFIKMKVNPSKVPVEGRDYGVMFIVFHVEKTFNPVLLEEKVGECLYLDNIEAPRNVNRANAITKLGEAVKKEMVARKEKTKIVGRSESMRMKKAGEKLLIAEEENDSEEGSSYATTEKKISGSIGVWYLDTAATYHVYKNDVVKDVKDKMFLGNGCEIEGNLDRGESYIMMKGNAIKLRDIFSTRASDINLLSYDTLMRNGVITGVKGEGDKIYLVNGDKVIFICEKGTSGLFEANVA